MKKLLLVILCLGTYCTISFAQSWIGTSLELVHPTLSQNGDATTITRSDVNSDETRLRIRMGDEESSLLEIGYNFYQNGQWTPTFTLDGYGNSFLKGRLGIGTTTPLSKLHISSAVERESFRIYREGNTSNYLNIFQGTGAASIDPIGTGLLYLGYDQSTNVVIGNNGGSLGIGTANPQSKLDIRGGAVQVVNYADGAYSFIGRNADSGNDSYFYHLVSPNFHILGSNKNGSGVQRKLGFALGGGDTENDIKMTIDAQGRIGMGTTSPGLKLHLFTSNSLDGLGVHHSNGAWVNFYSPSMTGGAYNGITQPGDGGLIFGTDSGLNSVSNGFVIAPHRNTVSGLRINNNGDVGIGTSSPDAKLTVNGTIHSKEVKIDLSVPGPDYVFANNYPLPTLNEIKAYIDQHKHLPELPSAKEMEANGVNVGEMNMILLKKVEELTLYAIEANKKIELLEKRSISSDVSGKKVEELTLQLMNQQKQIEELKEAISKNK